MRVPRRRLRFLACLVVMMFIVWTPGSAAAFGTVDTGGQRREHERVTRAALACAGEAASDPYCFEPGSIDYLAGHDREFGAVGAPDSDELSDPAAHCDNADFLEGRYPRTRDQATASLVACVNHMRTRFAEGVEAARGLLDDQGQVIPRQVSGHRRTRPGPPRNPGLLRPQQLGRSSRPGPADRRRQSAGSEPTRAE